MKKAAIAWLTVGRRPAYPVWCAWIDDALLVVSGPGEQRAPGLAHARTATVTARGDHGGAIVSWPALVERMPPGAGEWQQLAAKRLNSLPAQPLAVRWQLECTLSRLTPLQ